jgi:protein-S-isoprenylcysteine O-methyltransferase Ste14
MKQAKSHGMLLLRSVLLFGFIICLTFLCAGRLDYWQGWVYNGSNIVFLILSYLLLPRELVEERLDPKEGMKKWDKIFYMISTPVYLATLIICVLDGGRFDWKPRISIPVIIIGIVLYITGQAIILWAKSSNRFFSSVVRIQTDRGQTVCKEGPYRFVRHPGYMGGLIYAIVSPLVLNSFWGLFPTIISIVITILRTSLEDETLQKELPGYLEYTKEVKYRLLPGIW